MWAIIDKVCMVYAVGTMLFFPVGVMSFITVLKGEF